MHRAGKRQCPGEARNLLNPSTSVVVVTAAVRLQLTTSTNFESLPQKMRGYAAYHRWSQARLGINDSCQGRIHFSMLKFRAADWIRVVHTL